MERMGRMRVASIGMAMAALTLGLTSPALGATSNGSLAGGEEWPMFMGGFTHAGASEAVGPSSTAISWTLKNRTGYFDRGMSPVVGSDGTIYLLQKELRVDSVLLKAISPTTHKTLWSWSGVATSITDSVPAVAPDGTVYVAEDGYDGPRSFALYAIENGTTRWKDLGSTFQHDVWGEPTIGPDGTVYVEAASALYALNPKNGHVYWSFASSTGGDTTDAPALSPDGTTLYLTSGVGDLYALSAGPTGGQLEWTCQLQAQPGADTFPAPAVGPDGTIYATTGGPDGLSPSDIDAVNPNGTLKWAYIANGGFETTPAVTAAGQVVAGNDSGTVVAVRQSDGTLAWSYAAPGMPGNNGFDNSSAASDANGNIYIENQYAVFALSPEGSLRWTVNGEENPFGSSPAIDDSGTLYVTGGNEALTAYEASS